MRKIYTILLFIMVCAGALAQVPQKMSYQSVIRNSSNQLVTSHAVGMRVSILQGSASGTAVYVETQTPTTNANGLATIEIGGGTPVTGTFSGIDWSTGTYFIKTETDPVGGTAYTITGTSQLLSVPYALYAKTTATSIDAVKITGNQTVAGIKTFTNGIVGSLNANNNKIVNVSNPTNAQDAATKSYVDALEAKIKSVEAGGFVADINGNIYNTVKIGTQIWMSENLKSTKYADGTAIPLITDNASWTNNTTGARCWYNNDSITYAAKYGALYNCYAVLNTSKLCPTGWHVPTDVEWTTLENYMIANGHNYDGTTTGNKIGKSLGSTTLWWPSTYEGGVGNTDFPNYRNLSGFNGFPGGGRSNDGGYSVIGGMGYWWSSFNDLSVNSIARRLDYNWGVLILGGHPKTHGFSVRCLKN